MYFNVYVFLKAANPVYLFGGIIPSKMPYELFMC